MDLDELDAWVFDLDGVLTDTAVLHEKAWRQMFDAFFAHRAEQGGPAPRPFTAADYHALVDGEARLDGVRNVLADREIDLPEGSRGEPSGTASMWQLAQQKDALYLELLRSEGPRPFQSSIELVRRLRSVGAGIAVVSASEHCAQVLDAGGLADLVDVRVDGLTARAMGLAGKPDPALFLEAARRLGIDPRRAAVVEDAVAGVEAGRRGGFSEVVGVHRAGDPAALWKAGATVVVDDLEQLEVAGRGPMESRRWLFFDDPGPDDEGRVETLGVLANGYLGTRAARPWAKDDGVSYPGTYLAGVYNRLHTAIADVASPASRRNTVQGDARRIGERRIEVESLVNVPNWLSMRLRASGGPWTGEAGLEVTAHRIMLDLATGTLLRRCELRDTQGHRSALLERRIVSMDEPHLAAQEVSLVPLNWSGTLQVRGGIDGGVLDDETQEDRLLQNRHLELVDQGSRQDMVWLRVRTVQSQILVGSAARLRVSGSFARPHRRDRSRAGLPQHEISVDVTAGTRVTVEKVVSIYCSKDRAISEPGMAARERAQEAPGFDGLLRAHGFAWQALWNRFTVYQSDLRHAEIVRLHAFHLLQVASPHFAELDAGLGARGLHGEGYRGHIFWDTVFVGPVFSLRFPEVVRAQLTYRSRRLPAARRAAAAAGYRGAMFPWQSGSDGRDETPTVLFNPRSQRWMGDRSGLQRHVGLAIAYEVWQHWQMTGDAAFISHMGGELVFDIARFFASLARFDEHMGRYRISGIMGPDEFHDGYPWSTEPGLVDNAYTNVMTAWLLQRAGELVALLENELGVRVQECFGVTEQDVGEWAAISQALHVPFHEGVISQFDGYERLAPLDLDAYRDRYGDIGRLDLILEAEDDQVDRYQVSKQADVLMLLYLLSAEELRAVLAKLGYGLEPEMILRTIDYYSQRATHGSTLSSVVHSWVQARADRAASWRHLQDALAADVAGARERVTREGVHLGAMAGTIDILERCYSGLEVRADALWLNPVLPPELPGLSFRIRYRGLSLSMRIDHALVRVEAFDGRGLPATLMVSGEPVVVRPGQSVEVPLS